MPKYKRKHKHGSWKEIKKERREFQRHIVKARHHLNSLGGAVRYPYPNRIRLRQLFNHSVYIEPTQEDYE